MPDTLHDLENGSQNKDNVCCKYCKSKMLSPLTATFVVQSRSLPLIAQKKGFIQAECEETTDFWLVEDMYTFDNIGFTFADENIKYLTCADCDVGPVGYHDIPTKKSYVALNRILLITPRRDCLPVSECEIEDPTKFNSSLDCA